MRGMTVITVIMINIFFSGCGIYTFTGHGIGGIETLTIQPFENQTAEFGIREELTDILITSMLKDRTLSVVDQGSADAVLNGNILSIEDFPLTYDDQETVSEYKVVITVSFVLKKKEEEKLG